MNVSTLLLSSIIIAINRVLCLREKVQRYPNPKRIGPKSIQIEDAVDSSAVNLADNYSATGDPILSAKNHQGNDCSRWLPVFVVLVIIAMLGRASTKHAHAHTHTHTHTHTHKKKKSFISSINVLGNACRGVL